MVFRLTSVATSAGFERASTSTLFYEEALGRMTFLWDKLDVEFYESSYSLSDLAQ